jgi:hypothetical protein
MESVPPRQRWFVGLTDLTLSCVARARVPKPCGRQVAAHTAGQRRAVCNRHDAAALGFSPGGSAAGPKPGRASSSVKLGRSGHNAKSGRLLPTILEQAHTKNDHPKRQQKVVHLRHRCNSCHGVAEHSDQPRHTSYGAEPAHPRGQTRLYV